jgi:hypothetical protein
MRFPIYGTCLPGSLVEIYLNGTSTPASVYAAVAGGAAISSVTAAADGTVTFFVDDAVNPFPAFFDLHITATGYADVDLQNVWNTFIGTGSPEVVTSSTTVTIYDLIKTALQEIGALAADETPSGSDTQLALKTLNMMLGAWSADNLRVRATVQENFPLVADTRSYTIGSTGVFATVKPLKILGAFVRDSSNNDSGLNIIGEDLYNSFTDKMISSGAPEDLYYDPGLTQQTAHLGTIFLSPIPSAADTLFIESQKVLTSISSVGATATFEPPYFEALAYNLAIRLWRKFHEGNEPIPMDTLRMASDSLLVIERMNSVTPIAGISIPGQSGGGFNVNTGDYN